MSKVIIFGTSDFAQIASIYLERDSDHDVVAFTVHREYLGDRRDLLGRPVLAWEDLPQSHPPDDHEMLVAVGFSKLNGTRAEIYDGCKGAGYRLITYVSSGAALADGVPIGDNTFIFEDNVIQPFVTIGSDTILWSGNHIGHHTAIGNHCFIASHAVVSGNVTIGDYSFIGVNATVRDGVTIAPRCVIGAGALIMRDTIEGGVYSVKGTEPLEKRSWDLTNF